MNFNSFANDILDLVWLVLCAKQNRICPRFAHCSTNAGYWCVQCWRKRLYSDFCTHSLHNLWCITASVQHTKQNKSDVMYVHSTNSMSGRSLMRDDSVTGHQERSSIAEHEQMQQGPCTSKQASRQAGIWGFALRDWSTSKGVQSIIEYHPTHKCSTNYHQSGYQLGPIM